MNLRFVSQFVLAAATLLASVAFADVLYKLIDKNGKVTYSEEKPKNFDGQVIRLDINPNANTVPRPASGANSGEPTRRPPQGNAKKAGPSPEERIAKARERLEAAQKALQDARDNPDDSDEQTIGTKGGIKKKGGGTREVPSAAYQAKLDQLEKAVKDAQEALQDAERGV
jgi:hypothetical protein